MANITHTIEICPFHVPEYVTVKGQPGRREHGMTSPININLSELSEETLEQLCKEFRDAVFAKAKKSVSGSAFGQKHWDSQ